MYRRANSELVRKVSRSGAAQHTAHFSARVASIDAPTAVAVVVSKKVASTAVARNRLKRRMREVVRSLPLPHHKAIVWYAKKGAPALTHEEMRRELTTLLSLIQ